MESIFAKFLWGGLELTKKIHEVKWDDICKPLDEGGLNIRRVKEMNNAGLMKQLWWIVGKKDSLWVKWIQGKYLEQNSFWTLKIPNDCSWSWRKLLKLRDKAEPIMKILLGNGNDTWLWLDNWHPCGVLLNTFGDWIRYDAGLDRLTKVNRFLEDGRWKPFPIRSDDLRVVGAMLSKIELLNVEDKDVAV